MNLSKIIHVTRNNLSWAIKFSGYSREELEELLIEAEVNDYVCAVEVKRGV